MNIDRVVELVPASVITQLSKAKAMVRRAKATHRSRPVLDESFGGIDASLLAATADAAVYRIADGETRSILKISFGEVSAHQLSVEARALEEIAAIDKLGPWREQIARVRDRGTHKRGTWFTQSQLPGINIANAVEAPEALIRAAASSLRPLHEVTESSSPGPDVASSVDAAIASLAEARPDVAADLERIRCELDAALQDRQLVVARLHGDFSPTNVLWDPETESVSAIVDWKFGTMLQPPEIDAIHFAISLACILNQSEYGSVVLESLAGTPQHEALLAAALENGPNEFDLRTAVLLTWVQHVSFGLEKAEDLRANPIWLVNNIDTVARSVAPTQ